MTAKLAEDDVAAVRAYAMLMQRVKRDDRRMLALIAMNDVRNLPVVTCLGHEGPLTARMTFTAAYRHMETATDTVGTPCRFEVDLTEVEVEQ